MLRMLRADRWRRRAAALKREALVLARACRDPRVPWYAKAVAIAVGVYALSPIDLIPDFIPVIGHLDDLVIVPLGVGLALRLIPAEVLDEHRRSTLDPDPHPVPRSGREGISSNSIHSPTLRAPFPPGGEGDG